MTKKLELAEQSVEQWMGKVPKTGATTFVFALAQMTTDSDPKWSACLTTSLQDITTHQVVRCFNTAIDRLMLERTEFIERKAQDLAQTIMDGDGPASQLVESLGYGDDQLLEACIKMITESADD